MSIRTTKPVLHRSGAFWMCRSWIQGPLLVPAKGIVEEWLPRLGWSRISREKAYENWKLSATGGDLSVEIEFVQCPSVLAFPPES